MGELIRDIVLYTWRWCSWLRHVFILSLDFNRSSTPSRSEGDLSADKINRDSWRGISKLLSRGYSLELDGEKTRVIGLNDEGGLSVLLEGEKSEIQSIEKLTWLF